MTSPAILLDASEHPVKSVTIFQSSTAELKRAFTVELKAGNNVIEIVNISSDVDKESPRIHGLGSDARVVDISCNTALANAPSHKRSKHAAEIKKLTAKRKILEGERAVRQKEFDLLDDAARSLVNDKATGLDVFMDTYVSRKRNAMRKIVDTDEQIEELDKEIWQLRNTHRGETAAVVTANVLAKHDCKLDIQLTYLVTGVTWQPYYDLHASTSDGKPSSDVSLHYCANVTQSTGEDWVNTTLTLSTANSHALRSLSVPRVDSLRLMPAMAPTIFNRGFGSNDNNVGRSVFGQSVGGGNAFGQHQQQQQQQQSAAFGQASSFGQISQSAQTGFGAFSQAAAQPPPQPAGLFGQSVSQPQPQGTGLFGRAASQPQSTGLFGRTGTPAGPGLFGTSTVQPPIIIQAPAEAPSPQGQFGGTISSTNAANGEPEDDFERVDDSPDAEEGETGQGAVLDRSPLSLAYRVEGKVTLPSDRVAHKVSIATLDFSAVLKYVCVPRKTTAAFIEGRIKNTSEYELLAGPVSVFMDDSFVTKTLLGMIGVNESFVCVLGIDRSLKVTYNTKSRTEYEPRRSFAEPSKTTTRTVVTTITNGHPLDITDLVVRDAIPLGNDHDHIQVMLRKPEGLAQAKDDEDVVVKLSGETKVATVRWTKVENGVGGEKDGLYEWVCGVKAGKKVQLEVEWDVKAPTSVRWVEQQNIRFGTAK